MPVPKLAKVDPVTVTPLLVFSHMAVPAVEDVPAKVSWVKVMLLEPVTGTGAAFVLFFGAVVVTAVWAGPGPGLFATFLSLPLGATVFIMRAGYTEPQAVSQAALFTVDCVVVVYLSSLLIRARRSAERSAAWQRAFIDLAPDAFFLADLEGRFTDVNQAACRLLGYSRDELLCKLSLIHI